MPSTQATSSPKPATIRQHCCQKHNVAGFGDIVAGFGDNDAVLATLSLVWTGLNADNNDAPFDNAVIDVRDIAAI